jgi:hypothetical protein
MTRADVVVRPDSVLHIEFGRLFKRARFLFGLAFPATLAQPPPVEPEKNISLRTTIHRNRMATRPFVNPSYFDGELQMAIAGHPELLK